MNIDKIMVKKNDPDWDGLTLDEMRYARALTMTRIEISRQLIAAQGRMIFNGEMPGTGKKTLMGKMLASINVIDYALIAMRVGSKLFGLYRRHR